MDKKIKPSEVVAARFQVSNETAKFFLGRVQKSFKTERPPHQLVVDFMSGQSYDALPKPYQIAKALHEKGIWAYPLNSEPVEPVDEDELY